MVERNEEVENPKYSALLAKHHLRPDLPDDALLEVATRMICYSPTNYEWYLVAFGDVPETFEQFASIMDFVKNTQSKDPYPGLQETLTKLRKTGKSIYPKEN